jgi:hypothetical protein
MTDDEQPDGEAVPARRVGSECIQTTGGAWILSLLVHAEPKGMPAEVEIMVHEQRAQVTHLLQQDDRDIQARVELTLEQARELAQTLLKIADELEADP